MALPPTLLHGETGEQQVSDEAVRPRNIHRARAESSSLATSFPNSLNQRTPARSYYQRSFVGPPAPDDNSVHASESVRQETAELASWAFSDATSTRDSPSPRLQGSVSNGPNLPRERSSFSLSQANSPDLQGHTRPEPIDEALEPCSPENDLQARVHPPISTLTKLIRRSPQATSKTLDRDGVNSGLFDHGDVHVVTVGNGIISPPYEGTSLLRSLPSGAPERLPTYGALHDVESQQLKGPSASKYFPYNILRIFRGSRASEWRIANPFSNSGHVSWSSVISRPARYLPAIVLGLLLNILDALSYGIILFPLGQAVFSELGPDGISMFYVSCIVSQLVYSLGGSIFKGGIGSEMIEVVPFFHRMAFTVLTRVGENNPKAVIATTIVSYSLSSILTGATFYIMGRCKLGSLIGFFPRHILIGCIGGVGWFLVATGVEVSARLQGNLEYNLATLQRLFHPDTVCLWTVPLLLSILLMIIKVWVKHPLTDATYFVSLIGAFHFLVAALSNLDLETLRTKGWIFEPPTIDTPFYHFYTLYDFRAVDWSALAATIPAMFALTFFGILHVPINIPALALTTGEDNISVDRELKAHGWSNALSGLCGSVQNYLVYTNTVLFIRSGGDSRTAGVLLAIATCGVLVVGSKIIGFIPVTVVASLIFFLGINLIKEALVDTFGRVHKLEYLTILIIVITMGAWDFVAGILVGIVLACVSFVLQTSQISAIRSALPGGVASSTVRRHPIQQRFLQQAGPQIHVMKLAGYLFFGTIVGVENRIRALLDEDAFRSQPVRFLIIDLSNVDGVDFSAAEAFTRVNRILATRGIDLIVSGTALQSEVGRSLSNVDLWNEENGVEFYEDLNSALEHCENELLKTFYRKRDSRVEAVSSANHLDIPQVSRPSISGETLLSSPRRNQLEAVAMIALQEHDMAMLRPQNDDYGQPLYLITQTFSTASNKDADFWRPTAPYFRRHDFAKSTVLYTRGDDPQAFYLLESGILRAEYKLPQGKFSEVILAGTTCGELPFFSQTPRTSTTITETACVVWALDDHHWESLQRNCPEIAQEFLKVSLKLTSERMDAITRYMLLTSS